MSLRAEEISYTWKFRGGECTALRSLSAEFVAGVAHVICGPSGSGKSTLGYLLAGLLPPDAGKVRFHEEDVRMQRMNIAFVFQFPENIFFEDSVQEELNQVMQHCAPDMNHFEQLGVPFEDIAQVHPFHLSAGYGRLAATAMQLARGPKVLILDEPTIGLDWRVHRRMMDTLKNWIAPQRHLILITHDLDVMRELGGCAWVLKGGTLAWSGTTADLLLRTDLLETHGLTAAR